MAHHKRKRPKSTRAGCLMCKPWKDQRCAKHLRMKFRDLANAKAADQMICEVVR